MCMADPVGDGRIGSIVSFACGSHQKFWNSVAVKILYNEG